MGRVVDGWKIANMEGLYEKREPHAKSPDFQYCIRIQYWRSICRSQYWPDQYV